MLLATRRCPGVELSSQPRHPEERSRSLLCSQGKNPRCPHINLLGIWGRCVRKCILKKHEILVKVQCSFVGRGILVCITISAAEWRLRRRRPSAQEWCRARKSNAWQSEQCCGSILQSSVKPWVELRQVQSTTSRFPRHRHQVFPTMQDDPPLWRMNGRIGQNK